MAFRLGVENNGRPCVVRGSLTCDSRLLLCCSCTFLHESIRACDNSGRFIAPVC